MREDLETYIKEFQEKARFVIFCDPGLSSKLGMQIDIDPSNAKPVSSFFCRKMCR